MPKGCEYTYNGKTYSEKEFKELLLKGEFDADISEAMPKVSEQIPPQQPPVNPMSFLLESSGKKRVSGLMRHIQESEKVSEETKSAFREKGIEYEVSDSRQAKKVASEIIDSVGKNNALVIARGTDMDASVRSAIFAESIDRAYTREKEASSPEEKTEAALEWAEISREYDKLLTQGGKFSSYTANFYKTSPLGFILKAEEGRKRMFEEWYGSKEKDFAQMFEEILKETEGKQEFDKRVEAALKEERKAARAAKKKKIDDFFDSLKIKDDAAYSAVIPPQLYNAAVEVIKKAYQAGETIANAISQGAEYISKNFKEDWDKDAFSRSISEKFSMQGIEGGKDAKSYSQILKDRIAELERRMKEKDYSAEKLKAKKELTEEESALFEEYKSVKERYDESKKRSLEWSERKANQVVEKFKKKIDGVSESQKREIIRNSVKELAENGILKDESFRKIVADAIGMKEFNEQQIKEIEGLVEDINNESKVEDEMVANPTKENYERFVSAKEKAIESQNKLFKITNTKSDLVSTYKSLVTGGLLSVFSLIKNVAQSAIYQSTVRFPKAVMRNIVELGVYGMSKALPGSKTFSPQSNAILAQFGYFKGLSAGAKRGFFLFSKDLQERDLSSKTAYQTSLSPKRAKEELQAWRKGDLFLDKTEVLDRWIRSTWVAKQANFILKGMGLGDNIQRFGAEFSTAMQIAVNEFKIPLKKGQILAFISSPKKYSYKLLLEQGKSQKEAEQISDEIQSRIIREGDRSTLQEETLVSNLSNWIDQGLKNTKDESKFKGAAKAGGAILKANTFPFVKIPANVYWQMFKVANPHFTFGYAMAQTALAAKYRKQGDLAKSREYNDKAIDNALTAMYGYGIAAFAASMVANGLVRGSNDEDKSYRETEGERVFGKQYQFNYGKLLGGNDYWVDLSWLGPIGGVFDVKARMYDEELERKRKGEEKNTGVEDVIDNFKFSLTSSLNSLVFDQAAKTYNAIAGGEKGVRVFTVNTLNNTQNIFTGATYAAISKALLPEKTQLKAEGVIEEIKNNATQRNVALRFFLGRPPSKISMWGEPIKNDNSFNGIASNVFGFEEGSENKFGALIYDDFRRTGNDKFFPQPVKGDLTVDGKRIKLNPEETRELQKEVGKIRKDFVSAFVYDKSKTYDGKVYSQLNDEEKVDALNVLYDMGWDLGKKKFFEKYPQYSPKNKQETQMDDIDKKIDEQMFKSQFNQ